uniref:ATP synthase F0 subunit 8 n=1 Tax=Acherontia styx TaxID=469309 RepID=UPI0028D25F7C|nr:ATP synthase F0 subunit 8 [Acherontia styx]WMQ52929.1 ATP synthase F0 subunit 8 [Acherontia styx]
MPQMMPINWIFSLLFFICIFIMFNIFNYYIYFSNLHSNNKKNKILKNNFFWKW